MRHRALSHWQRLLGRAGPLRRRPFRKTIGPLPGRRLPQDDSSCTRTHPSRHQHRPPRGAGRRLPAQLGRIRRVLSHLLEVLLVGPPRVFHHVALLCVRKEAARRDAVWDGGLPSRACVREQLRLHEHGGGAVQIAVLTSNSIGRCRPSGRRDIFKFRSMKSAVKLASRTSTGSYSSIAAPPGTRVRTTSSGTGGKDARQMLAELQCLPCVVCFDLLWLSGVHATLAALDVDVDERWAHRPAGHDHRTRAPLDLCLDARLQLPPPR